VLQFTVSVTLIIGTLVVFRQIKYGQDRPIGYDRGGLIYTGLRSQEMVKHFQALRNDLLQTGVVDEVSCSQNPVTDAYTTNSGYDWKGKDPAMSEEFVTVCASHEFGKTVGWTILDGRDFSSEIASDSSAFVINEAAAKYMGLEDPVGEVMKWNNNGSFKIIGLIKDMVMQSPYAPVRPMIFFVPSRTLSFARINVINIKIRPSSSAQDALAKIERVYKKYDPANPFEYNFADEQFAKKFGNEMRIAKLATVFASLAIFISCLGLFGLASFVAEQRTKEIGIRKVMGASIGQLWQLISRDFIVLVIISCFIAIPISFYLMKNWLLQYSYQTPLSWYLFAYAGSAALFIALLTVSFQAVKASTANPAKSLRME
jgi:ABC-type antimicrobial peptide transport system permease subunit